MITEERIRVIVREQLALAEKDYCIKYRENWFEGEGMKCSSHYWPDPYSEAATIIIRAKSEVDAREKFMKPYIDGEKLSIGGDNKGVTIYAIKL